MTTDQSNPPSDRLGQNLGELQTQWAQGAYYGDAEPYMESQWQEWIYPLIKNADFTNVLELAPGHGRNTEKLRAFAREMHLVDINSTCIEACKKRFEGRGEPPRMYYYVNDGAGLPMSADNSITFFYSWDAMVHFDPVVIRKYVSEFRRVLRPGGFGFCHHSNFGTIAADKEANWLKNPAWRSTMTGQLFRDYCREAGLVIETQKLIPWFNITSMDCISTFRKPLV